MGGCEKVPPFCLGLPFLSVSVAIFLCLSVSFMNPLSLSLSLALTFIFSFKGLDQKVNKQVEKKLKVKESKPG